MKIRLALTLFLCLLTLIATPVTAEISLTGVEPQLLKIPSLSLEAPIIGVSRENLTNPPDDGETVFWYKDGVNPGGRGSAVLAGHFDDYKGPAIFYSLKDLKVYDMVYVIDQNNEMIMFEVEEVKSYRRKEASVDQLFSMNDGAYLQLVTCDGYYSRKEHTHSHRLIVRAKKVGRSHSYRSDEGLIG